MDAAPLVATPLGQVLGTRRTTIYDDHYYSFEGIPFAKPPLGELRFRAPQPPDPWDGVRNCTAADYKPMQRSHYTGQTEGSEDCLYLNVYAKTLTSEQPLPVMVWIHGGRFLNGDCCRESYGPDYFMQRNIVLVAFNYRVCSLGFLSLPDPELQVPGNAGLKDQVMALKWVKRYITHFNGDANNITIFGNSAGGMSAHYLAITDATRRLFHKVILMSGTSLSNVALIPPGDSAFRLARHHGYQGENIDREVLGYLRSLKAEQLVSHDLITEEYRRNDYLYVFAPTVEPYLSEHCVIPRPPIEMMRTAWSNSLPLMLGGTSFEGLVMYPKLKAKPAETTLLRNEPDRVLPGDVRASYSAEERKRLAEKIIRIHFSRDLTNHYKINTSLFGHLDFYSCKLFSVGLYRTMLSRLAYAPAPTYLYRFDFDSPHFNRFRLRFCGKDPVRGVAHADDVSYLFRFCETRKLAPETYEYQTIKRMVGMWTAFASKSDPNCKEIASIDWAPLRRHAPYLVANISHRITIAPLPEGPKLDAWASLYKREELY